MNLLDNIKKARLKVGYSQEYMAEKLGIATVNYGKIERGKTQMTIDRLYDIAELLNISVGSLLEIEVPKIEDGTKEILITENEYLKKRIVELESQLEDKKRLAKYFDKDILDIKLLILNWVEEFHLTEADFIKIANPEAIEDLSLFKSLSSESIDKEAELLASFVKGGYFSDSDIESKFGDKEIFAELMSRYRKLI